MKPVQNLDRINPITGLPFVEFVPALELTGYFCSTKINAKFNQIVIVLLILFHQGRNTYSR